MATSNPELIYIALCREVLENPDGSRSLIGILGSFVGSSSSEVMPPLVLKAKGIVAFYLEDKSATYPIQLTMQTPDGREIELGNGHVGRFGHLHTPIITLDCNLTFRNPGTFWFCCRWNGALLGRFPLSIDYQTLDEQGEVH